MVYTIYQVVLNHAGKKMATKEQVSDASEVKITKYIVNAFAIVLSVLVLSIAGCEIKSMPYDEKESERKHALRVKEADRDMAANTAIENLIKGGTNPVAARCAVKGWNNSQENEMCRQFTPSVDEELANKILALAAAVKDVTKDVSDLRKQPPMVQKP